MTENLIFPASAHSLIKPPDINISDYNQAIELMHDFELACPVFLEILRQFLRKHMMCKWQRLDWLTDQFRDRHDILFYMQSPFFDDVIKSKDGSIIRHFINGSTCRNYDLLRWIAALAQTDPEFALVIKQYNNKTLH